VILIRDGVQWLAHDGDKKYGWVFCNDHNYAEMLYCTMINIKTCLTIKSGQHMTEFAKVIIEKLNNERDKYSVKYPDGKKIHCINFDVAKQHVEEYNLEAIKQLKIGGYST
jgi:hypothetical protein